MPGKSHDNVGHVLSRSILLTAAVRAVNNDPKTAPLMDSLEDSLNAAMNSIRSSVHDLHDESVNLEHAVDSLIHPTSPSAR
ncbi:MAG: histidine kinase [Blautia wexlerae]